MLEELRLYAESRRKVDVSSKGSERGAAEPPHGPGPLHFSTFFYGGRVEGPTLEGLGVEASIERYLIAVEREVKLAFPSATVKGHWKASKPGEVFVEVKVSWTPAENDEAESAFLSGARGIVENTWRGGTWAVPLLTDKEIAGIMRRVREFLGEVGGSPGAEGPR